MVQTPDDLLNKTLGNYKLTRILGVGGMGVVYAAVEQGLQRPVAVKVLPPNRFSSGSERALKRFIREAKVIANLNHPNLIHLYHAGEQDGVFYYAMEFVEGRTLSKVVSENGPLPDEDLGLFCGQILGALGSCHSAGIVHRDVKSENIMLAQAERWLLMDFGLASTASGETTQLTQQGAVMGTPETMSPEQVEGKLATALSDLYSFGVVLFYAASGQMPFAGDTAISIMKKHIDQPPPRLETVNPSAPKGLADIVDKLLAKNPSDRPQDVRLLAARLSDIFDNRELRRVADGKGISIASKVIDVEPDSIDPTAQTVPADERAKMAAASTDALSFAGGPTQSSPSQPLTLSGPETAVRGVSRSPNAPAPVSPTAATVTSASVPHSKLPLIFSVFSAVIAVIVLIILLTSGRDSNEPSPSEPAVVAPLVTPPPDTVPPPHPQDPPEPDSRPHDGFDETHRGAESRTREFISTRLKDIADAIDLTPDQRKDVRSKIEALKTDESFVKLNDELDALLSPGERMKSENRRQVARVMGEMTKRINEEIVGVLTDDQREKYRKYIDDNRERGLMGGRFGDGAVRPRR